METHFINSLSAIPPEAWDVLWNTDYPFIQHHFLLALEESGCTTEATGWQPHHLLITDNDIVIAALPRYLKTHSYGEYVFDWAWAEAYQRYGLQYYPKLVSGIPFTPASGPRLGIDPVHDETQVMAFAVAAVKQEAARLGASSWHYLFPKQEQHQQLSQQQMMPRLGCQFHWFNNAYKSFDDFLSTFNSRKRKSLRRERRQVAEQGVTLQRLTGKDISDQHWQQFYHFYHATYLKRTGGGGYLTAKFFKALAARPEQIMMVVAEQDNNVVAAALYFFDSDTLYGRYWGTLNINPGDEIPGLHFEACYYQGIEFAIEKNLKRFDPGAQGEHKIQRGFTPVLTYSNHWLADPRLSAAVDNFLQRESEGIRLYQQDCFSYLPFKETP